MGRTASHAPVHLNLFTFLLLWTCYTLLHWLDSTQTMNLGFLACKQELVPCSCLPSHTSEVAVNIHVCADSHHILYVVTVRELGHMMQQQSAEAQYQQNNKRTCGGVRCFKCGCCCKEATNSGTAHLHVQCRFFAKFCLVLLSEWGRPYKTSHIWMQCYTLTNSISIVSSNFRPKSSCLPTSKVCEPPCAVLPAVYY